MDEIQRWATGTDLTDGVAERLMARLVELQAATDRSVHLCLTGGRIANRIYSAFADLVEGSGLDTSRIELWWGDERFVPTEDPDRNAGHTLAILARTLQVTPAHTHAMSAADGVTDNEASALTYASDTDGGPQHGYFFLDSGRRRIEAIDEVGDPARERQLRQRWNIELRDQVTLPLIPRLLEDALGAKVIDTAQLATLVGALQTSPWFADHQDAVCASNCMFHELGNIVSWTKIPLVKKNIHAFFNQPLGKGRNPRLVFLRVVRIGDEHNRGCLW